MRSLLSLWLSGLCGLVISAWAAAPKASSSGIGETWPPSPADKVVCISGVYPHLAVFNPYGECGIGAVVPWAGKG